MAKSRFDIAAKKTTRAREQTKRVDKMESEKAETAPLKIIRVSADYHLKAKTAASANGETLQKFIESLIDSYDS